MTIVCCFLVVSPAKGCEWSLRQYRRLDHTRVVFHMRAALWSLCNSRSKGSISSVPLGAGDERNLNTIPSISKMILLVTLKMGTASLIRLIDYQRLLIRQECCKLAEHVLLGAHIVHYVFGSINSFSLLVAFDWVGLQSIL
ncbi:hypothetical protein B0O80DRAFT_81259 [Mortierella sp. GBAus27b]|nr:hypothetical protein B0O80DRAFT_81259 [Mortierella sp. GBAus27b]